MIANNHNDNWQSITVIQIVQMMVRNEGNFEKINIKYIYDSLGGLQWSEMAMSTNIANSPNLKRMSTSENHILHIFAHQILAVSGGFGQLAKTETPDEWLWLESCMCTSDQGSGCIGNTLYCAHPAHLHKVVDWRSTDTWDSALYCPWGGIQYSPIFCTKLFWPDGCDRRDGCTSDQGAPTNMFRPMKFFMEDLMFSFDC